MGKLRWTPAVLLVGWEPDTTTDSALAAAISGSSTRSVKSCVSPSSDLPDTAVPAARVEVKPGDEADEDLLCRLMLMWFSWTRTEAEYNCAANSIK